jgi:hypothetical protein
MAIPAAAQVPGFLRVVKAGAVSALQQSLSWVYPEQDEAGGTQPIYISIEYPKNPADYPGVWVDFEVSLLQTVGIDHTELTQDGQLLTHWRFQGYATFTVTSLDNSNQCDALYDQLIAAVAFASQSDFPSSFRQAVEENPLVSTTWSFDKIEGRGQGAAPGTPWGSDEIIYERSIGLQVIGEFLTQPVTLELYPLSEIVVQAQAENDDHDAFTLTIR